MRVMVNGVFEKETIMDENELILRKLLWLNHGHALLYGDDGEMQCHNHVCMLDFKRDSVKTIQQTFEKQDFEQMKAHIEQLEKP